MNVYRSLILGCSFCLVVCWLAPSFAQAAPPRPLWGKYGTEINNSPGNTPQQNPRVTNSGNAAYVVWEDSRFGYSRIYAQKLDLQGNRLWSEGGIRIWQGTPTGNHGNPRLIADGNDGVIVTWQGYTNGSTDIFAQRLGSGGELLWGGEGVLVCGAPYGQFAPELVPDEAGGAIIVWHDYRSGSGEDIYAQRLDPQGRPLWSKDGIAVCAANGTQWYPQITADGAGGAVIAWTDGRGSAADNNIFAQRLDPQGRSLWVKDGIAVCAAPQNQEKPQLILGDNSEVILVWNDFRHGNLDLYAQKMDPNGQPLWDKDGVAVCVAQFSQENPRLAPDGSGGAIFVWTDKRSEENAVYIQRLSRDGRPLWGESGRRLNRYPSRQENPEILKKNNGDWLIFWEDGRYREATIFSQKINSSGVTVWGEGGIPVAPIQQLQEKAAAVLAANNSVIFVWQDRRKGNFDIFAQRLSDSGSPLWTAGGTIVCDAAGSVLHQNLKMINAGQGNIIAVFEDARSGLLNIYAQKIDPGGNLLWGKNAVPVAKIAGTQTNPNLVSDGAGGAIIAWEDQRNPAQPRIFVQRLNASGTKVWESSLPVASSNGRQGSLVAIADGENGMILFWEDERNALSLRDLYAQRISPRGELLWGKNGLLICGENGDQTELSAVADGSGGAFIAWTDSRRGDRNPDIYLNRVNGKGTLLWGKEGILVCGAPDLQRNPRLQRDGEGGVIVVWTDKGSGSYDIYAQRVSGDGKTLWLTDGIPVNQSPRTQQNPVFANEKIIIWEDYRNGHWDILGNALSPQGRLLWGEGGAPVVSVAHTQYAPQAGPWKNSGAIVSWEDYRSGKQYEIYYQQVDGNGRQVWQENGLMVETTNGARAPKVLTLPQENAFVIVWEDYTGGGKALFGQKYSVN